MLAPRCHRLKCSLPPQFGQTAVPLEFIWIGAGSAAIARPILVIRDSIHAFQAWRSASVCSARKSQQARGSGMQLIAAPGPSPSFPMAQRGPQSAIRSAWT